MMKKKKRRFSARADREFRGWHLRFGGLIYSGGARKFLVCVFEDSKPEPPRFRHTQSLTRIVVC